MRLWKQRGTERRVMFAFPGEKLGCNIPRFFKNGGLEPLDSHVARQIYTFPG
jgi:hypothetical protein